MIPVLEQESKELEKDEGRLKEMLSDSDCILPGNTQCTRVMLAKIRNMILVLLRQEMESSNKRKAHLIN